MSETVSQADGTASGTGARASLWEDVIDVFTSPTAVFERRRDGDYAGGVALVAAIAALVFVATKSLWQPYFDRQFEVAMAAQQASGKLTAEQMEQGRAIAERFAGVGIWGTGLVGPSIFIMFVALVVLGAARLTGARVNYGQALVVAAMAWVPRVVASVVGAGVLAMTDVTRYGTGVVPTSPGALVGPSASPFLLALLNRFDPFVLWGTVLIAIGVAVMGRVPRAKGFTAAALVWGFATLGALLGAARAVAAAG